MEIGAKIKQLRLGLNLTQEELAARCELTKGYISQLENDLTSPSISTLMDLLSVLGISLGKFFSDEMEEKVVFGSNEYFENVNGGVSMTWLVPNSQRNHMEPIITTLDVGAATTPDMPHDGEEFGYVLSGKIRITLGKSSHTCKKGESFYFAAGKEHFIQNIGSSEAKIIWVSTPPNF